MSTKFFTNRDDNSLLKKFKRVFENNIDIYKLTLFLITLSILIIFYQEFKQG